MWEALEIIPAGIAAAFSRSFLWGVSRKFPPRQAPNIEEEMGTEDLLLLLLLLLKIYLLFNILHYNLSSMIYFKDSLVVRIEVIRLQGRKTPSFAAEDAALFVHNRFSN
jgi:hypothetical protein